MEKTNKLNFPSVKAKRHTPPYKIHRYFARRPWNVFKLLLEQFSSEGDIVLDPFSGGGVTIYEGIKLGRKVIGFDINPLSIFIIRNMLRKVDDLAVLDNYYEKIREYLRFIYHEYYSNENIGLQVSFNETRDFQIEWNELAHEVKCVHCGEIVVLSNENKIKNGLFSCQNKNCKGNQSNDGYIRPIDCERVGYRYLYSEVSRRGLSHREKIPFSENRLQNIQEHLRFLSEECIKQNIAIGIDEIPLNWDRQHEDLLEKKNVKYFQDLFTKRNLLINSLLLHNIKGLKLQNKHQELREIFRLVFSSSLRDTNNMSFTNASWQSGRPSTWSKHAYWLPSQFCEVNVLLAFDRAYRRMRNSLEYNANFDFATHYAEKPADLEKNKNIYLESVSIDESSIPDSFVDVIITDPPYGSNVQYLELSQFWNVWNKDIYEDISEPDYSKEAVANRKSGFQGSKDFYDYEENLFRVFEKSFQALKPAGYLVMTFNNKDLRAWFAVQIAVFRAGFSFLDNGLIFQQGVKNYRQTAHTKYRGSPYGDFIHIFTKPSEETNPEFEFNSELDFISKIDELFSKYMRENRLTVNNANQVKTKMFLHAIPLIEAFANSPFIVDHSIYTTFSKSYLDDFYNKQ